jgi:hypothetical protein
MANYIGNQPTKGEFRKIDAPTFNGSTTAFNLTSGSIAFHVGSATQLLISINGVMQEPNTAYNVVSGGSQIQFTTAPAAGTAFFGVALSGLGDEATVGDGQITAAKLETAFNNTLARKGTAIALSIALG